MPFDVDEAFIDLQTIVNLRVGQSYLPFGSYHTHQVNDSLLLEVAETQQTALVASQSLFNDVINISAFGFKGAQEDNLDNLGARFSVQQDSLVLNLDYIHNLRDSAGLQDFIQDVDPAGASDSQTLAAYGAFAGYQFDVGSHRMEVTAELLKTEDVNAQTTLGVDGPLTAWHVESAITLDLEQPVTLSVAQQQTENLQPMGLPEQRYSVSAATHLTGNVYLSSEYWVDEDYKQKDGGTGKQTQSLVVLLGAEF